MGHGFSVASMRKNFLFLFATAAFLLGCAATPICPIQNISGENTQWAKEKGTARISGQAFMVTQGGFTKTAAGAYIFLLPDTSDIRAFLDQLRPSKKCWIPEKEFLLRIEAAQLTIGGRSSQGDAEGKFFFSDLPAGKWILVSSFHWMIPEGYTMVPTGGRLVRAVDISDAEEKTIILSNSDRIGY